MHARDPSHVLDGAAAAVSICYLNILRLLRRKPIVLTRTSKHIAFTSSLFSPAKFRIQRVWSRPWLLTSILTDNFTDLAFIPFVFQVFNCFFFFEIQVLCFINRFENVIWFEILNMNSPSIWIPAAYRSSWDHLPWISMNPKWLTPPVFWKLTLPLNYFLGLHQII